MIIDLRSDTVTKPTPAMLEYMFAAPVGDDVFEEDPTVNALEEKAASLFGKEAGLFCPSGTMTNQVAIKILTQSPQEIICDKGSHVYFYEGGGIAFNSGLSVRLVNGDRGRITAADVSENINADNVHFPHTSLVALENTSNKGGGSIYPLKAIEEISAVCAQHFVKLHLDGARIFNAVVAAGYSAPDIGKYFDTISVCLSKGLGAPVGSVLLSSKENIKKARRIRKVFGGGMRQAGFIAAAGLYALENNIQRLKDDHARAKQLEKTLQSLSYVEEVMPVETNIILFRLKEKLAAEKFIQLLADQNIKAFATGKQQIRFVTHLDFTDDMLESTMEVLKNVSV